MKSIAQLKAAFDSKYGKKKKKSKYNARRESASSLGLIDGYRFDSNLERNLYACLKSMVRAGTLRDVQPQVTVYLSDARIPYRVDFSVFDLELGETVWWEAKGFETSDWRIKKKLWSVYGPGRLRIVREVNTFNLKFEEINPMGASK
jgi:hypothetical protein